MMDRFDLTVLGAGPGGYVAAIRAAQRGASVALIERDRLGGTCLNVGCIPTKCYIRGAELLDQIRQAADFGVRVPVPAEADWPAMVARKNRIVDGLRQGVASLLKSNGVKVLQGTGAFESRRVLRVEGEGEPLRIESKATIIATGSVTAKPAFVPRAANVYYSTEVLDLPALPASLLILGGGVIGCEFACLFARLGVPVTLVEMLPEILPMVDRDVARVVRHAMKLLGAEVFTGQAMEALQADGRTVSGEVGGKTLRADALLVCVGRKAYSESLNLAAAGLALNDKGCLDVTDSCRTRAPGIYAIGDVAGAIQYAHRASAMGLVAAANATGDRERHSDALVPSCIFTLPEIGAVGLTEDEAAAEGLKVNTGKYFLAGLGKAQIEGAAEGFCKIVADAETDQVLGVQIVGAHATELIAESATAMSLEITAAELGRAIHAHPTLAEATMEAAHAVHNQCIHMPPRRRPPAPPRP